MQRAGKTQVQLVRETELSARTIAHYLAGTVEPPAESRDRLAAHLGFPSSFFLGEEPRAPSVEGVSFRAKSAMTARQRGQAIGASALAIDFVDWAAQYVRLPEPDVPRLRDVDPDSAAAAVRAEWGLGEAPIVDMIALLERHGVRVFSLADECREIDGYSFWHEGTPYVFLNTMTSAERSRMDAAHELGHLVMHFWGGELSSRLAEEQAKQFASAFLMPPAGFAGTARPGMSVAQVITHKAQWRVSAMAYARRLSDLGYLSDWQSKVLYRELSAAGYRTREPNPGRRETSSVWRALLTGLRANHGMTRGQIASALGFSAEMLDGLLFGLVLTQLAGGDEQGPLPGHEPHDLRLL